MSKSFLNVIKEIEKSNGRQLDSKAYVLENSFIMAVVNFGEFENFTEEIPVFSQEQRRQGESRKYMLNAARLFTNYLASICALKDHTRKFMRNIYRDTYGHESENEAFDGAYGEKIKEDFQKDALSQFVEDLRNYSQHYEVVPASLVTRVKDGNFYSELFLDKKTLLESNWEWKKGKKYLDEVEEIELTAFARTYLYKNVFPWIMQQQAREHSEEFAELERLKEVARNMLKENHRK